MSSNNLTVSLSKSVPNKLLSTNQPSMANGKSALTPATVKASASGTTVASTKVTGRQT